MPRHNSITDEFIAWLWHQVEASTSDAPDEPEEIWEAVNQVEEGKTRAEIMRDLVTYRLIGGKTKTTPGGHRGRESFKFAESITWPGRLPD